MKVINIILIIGFVFSAWSCTDYLETKPLTGQTTGVYYTTADNAYEALVGCYDGLQWAISSNDGGNGLPVVCDAMSDLCFGGTGVPDKKNYRMFDEFDKSVEPSLVNEFEGNWINYYKTINRCNLLINNIGNIDWGDDKEIARNIEGEARFLRAYCYLDMVRMWEKVPLLTESSKANIPQSEPKKVYKVIAGDLLFAVDNCRNTKYENIAASDYGHATKWAAKALLARAYLFYTGYYNQENLVDSVTGAEALQHLEDIIEFSGHGLLESFYDLWPAAAQYKAVLDGNSMSQNTYAGENNKEVVFGIKYTYDTDYEDPKEQNGNDWMVMNGIRKQSFAKYGYGYGWGACTVLPEVYNNWNDTDDRKHASIMAVEEENINFTGQEDQIEYTGYYTKKYIPLCDSAGVHTTEALGSANFMVGQYQDYFAIRYADVLLMAAELGSSNAMKYLNDVHTRSCPDPLTSIDKDIIFEERKLEFAFEGVRYWDLLRYDHTLQYAANAVTYSGIVLNGGVETAKVINGQNLINTRGLFQIPKNQITLSNNVLEQNPGWK